MGVHHLKRGTAACERPRPINSAKIRLSSHSNTSWSKNESDDVSFIGPHLALLHSQLKHLSDESTKPEQLIALTLAHQ